MLEIRELTRDVPEWNELLDTSPQGTAFLRSDWLAMLAETEPGLAFIRLGCYDEKGRLVGGQALPYRTQWGLRISVPFEFFYCGPVLLPSPSPNLARRMHEHHRIMTALARAASDRLDYVEFDTNPDLGDVRSLIYDGWQAAPTYAHIWQMGDRERTWQDMNREKRREIRHAQKAFGFSAEESDAALDRFLPLYHQTMAKFTWRPSARWEDVFRRRFHWLRRRDGCRLYTLRTPEGELMGGVVVLLSREDRTAYLWRQGSSPALVEAGGVPALYWLAACDLAADFPRVNFGGSPQESLSHFKDYLGATAVPHFAVSRCNRPRRIAMLTRAQLAKDTLYNAVMRVAFGPWQRLRYGRRPIGAVNGPASGGERE